MNVMNQLHYTDFFVQLKTSTWMIHNHPRFAELIFLRHYTKQVLQESKIRNDSSFSFTFVFSVSFFQTLKLLKNKFNLEKREQ